ncbi:MAG: hypothetical protein ACRDNB_01715 [Gaiellaceae bacterium]
MKGDKAIDAGADKLEDLSGKAAAKGGMAGRLSGELADDARFLRKLKPSLMVRRAKGELPRDADPAETQPRAPAAPTGPQVGQPRGRKQKPNPFAVAAAAFGAGTLLAKLIDWRGHAHPRR